MFQASFFNEGRGFQPERMTVPASLAVEPVLTFHSASRLERCHAGLH